LTDSIDLTEQLALAAAEAVRVRRGAIEAGAAGYLRGIAIEIETMNGGAVLAVMSCLSWKDVIRSAAREAG